MQGSVWGSLFCTTTMDKLGQLAYEDESLLYLYKGVVSVPPICMVDDILSIQKCPNSVRTNAIINAFIEVKKLTLSEKKCHQIHIGKPSNNCPELKVHKNKMRKSESERYLGDIVDKRGNVKATIADRVAKGYGIISEIQAILKEVPLGKYKLEIGLKLRQAMLINGMLYNSEAWHNVTEEDILALQKVDEMLLRFLLNIQSKAPLEFLYLESGALPIKYIVASRRMTYLQTLLRRDDEELTKRILKAQVDNPCTGDFTKLVQEDFKMVDMTFDTNVIEHTSVEDYKAKVKQKIREAALKSLKNIQKTHSKVKDIIYDELKTQPYLKSPLFSNTETSLLSALRSRTADTFKANFRNKYGNVVSCPLVCWGDNEGQEEDTQKHLLSCRKLKSEAVCNELATGKIVYEDIFSDVKKQKEVVHLFSKLIEARLKILKEKDKQPPGDDLDPSMGSSCLRCIDAVFTSVACINCTYTGN